ncbi:MAG TPA: bifunctional DNA-binding transcriptional regulator/O6-methylguanine-DNA methyltransferase Ada [Hansschlegelia sp.]
MTHPETQTETDPRWRSVVDRESAADGTFVYSVASTGVYCRPSCPSRLAKPANVRFHATCEAAERAGFRPCLRCRPNETTDAQGAAVVARICREIERAEQPPKLEALAASAGLSASHLHRLFKAKTGVTPRAYAAAERARRVRSALAQPGASVTAALYDAGFGSNGRFYEASNAVLGMKPGAYRARGAGAEIRFAVGECSLGSVLVAQSERGVCAILLGDDPEALVRDLQDRFSGARLVGGDAAFETVVAQVVGFVDAPGVGLDLPLDIRGTAFQQRVWAALRRIPAGATASYAAVAAVIGAPKAMRAVAGACAANPLAVAVPCHRVVRTDGALSGYRWGVERKRALLERERGA